MNTTGERFENREHYQPEIAEEARARQEATQIKNGKPPVKEIFLNRENRQTRDVIGKIVGVSGRTLEKAVKINKSNNIAYSFIYTHIHDNRDNC